MRALMAGRRSGPDPLRPCTDTERAGANHACLDDVLPTCELIRQLTDRIQLPAPGVQRVALTAQGRLSGTSDGASAETVPTRLMLAPRLTANLPYLVTPNGVIRHHFDVSFHHPWEALAAGSLTVAQDRGRSHSRQRGARSPSSAVRPCRDCARSADEHRSRSAVATGARVRSDIQSATFRRELA